VRFQHGGHSTLSILLFFASPGTIPLKSVISALAWDSVDIHSTLNLRYLNNAAVLNPKEGTKK
jgi:hypothetical protein